MSMLMFSFLLCLSLSTMIFNGRENMNTRLLELKINENIHKMLSSLFSRKTAVRPPPPLPPPVVHYTHELADRLPSPINTYFIRTLTSPQCSCMCLCTITLTDAGSAIRHNWHINMQNLNGLTFFKANEHLLPSWEMDQN